MHPPHPQRSLLAARNAAVALAVLALVVVAAPTAGRADPPAMATGVEQQGFSLDELQAELHDALGLFAGDLVVFDTPGGIEPAMTIETTIDGFAATIDLALHSVRDADYELLVQGDDGALTPQAPGPVRTYRGVVRQMPGSVVAASLLPEGLLARVLVGDGEQFWIEPAAAHVGGTPPGMHVVYRPQDVIPNGGTCAWNEAFQAGFEDGGEDAGGGGGIAGGGVFDCTELAIDADYQYYLSYGASVAAVEARILDVINAVNVQYESQVDITHSITAIVVRTSSGANPYSTNNAGDLLSQVRNVWSTLPEADITKDLAELFTGRNIDGSTIGIAWLGVVCDFSGGAQGYSVVQSDCCGSFSCTTDLTAHELGHNWSAGHCDCSGFTMNPSINCGNDFTAGSIGSIIAHRNSRACLGACSGPGPTTSLPFFEDFPTDTLDTSLWVLDDTTAVINDLGDNEPSGGFSANLDGNSSDGGDELRSAFMDITGLVDVTLSYQWQRTGTAQSPEPGEDLVLEYEDVGLNWIEIDRQLGEGPDGDPYQLEQVLLPPGAYHEKFRFRFRVESSDNGNDDFFVDDVSVDGLVPPFNNDCTQAILVEADTYGFSTIGSSTDGFSEAGACGLALDSDIWYRTFALCAGELTVTMESADFPVELAIYEDFVCPTGADEAAQCLTGLGSITIDVVSGAPIRIRIGGVGAAEGTGTFSVDCTATCPSDCAGLGDGSVDVSDLLEMLAQWGTGDGCDVDGSGSIDVTDLLELLASWGIGCGS